AETVAADFATLIQLREWVKTTETGDGAEVAFLAESSEVWNSIDARRESCTGQKCNDFDRCFITTMHRKALEADLVIVNHHLLFADLALKQSGIPGVGILPKFDALILDEAHE